MHYHVRLRREHDGVVRAKQRRAHGVGARHVEHVVDELDLAVLGGRDDAAHEQVQAGHVRRDERCDARALRHLALPQQRVQHTGQHQHARADRGHRLEQHHPAAACARRPDGRVLLRARRTKARDHCLLRRREDHAHLQRQRGRSVADRVPDALRVEHQALLVLRVGLAALVQLHRIDFARLGLLVHVAEHLAQRHLEVAPADDLHVQVERLGRERVAAENDRRVLRAADLRQNEPLDVLVRAVAQEKHTQQQARDLLKLVCGDLGERPRQGEVRAGHERHERRVLARRQDMLALLLDLDQQRAELAVRVLGAGEVAQRQPLALDRGGVADGRVRDGDYADWLAVVLAVESVHDEVDARVGALEVQLAEEKLLAPERPVGAVLRRRVPGRVAVDHDLHDTVLALAQLEVLPLDDRNRRTLVRTRPSGSVITGVRSTMKARKPSGALLSVSSSGKISPLRRCPCRCRVRPITFDEPNF
eukprot:Unigene1121_Nuclearia_a/m.3599 Unigene1121_Nuclearia_a/g.3599  ORF Unigene1121_Nuclearia_a/g.3599 Unigene1121_Nuclearia_a/m.3599 type:complete len:477 (-) Unigene1121_Nuclearia_a:280-1710(-)